MMFTRCKTCLMPTTRPDTAFVDGECSACVNYKNRPNLDWDARLEQLDEILRASRTHSGYDCIVPSSGGKDSTYQVLRVLEMGYRPLVVTASTCMLTPIGRKNIDNLARYATTIEVTPNTDVRRILNRFGLETVGDVSLPEHWAIFSIPFRVAADFGIPTILYGECPQNAYGGPIGTEEARTMTRRWTNEFGGYLGMRPQDMIGVNDLTYEDMLDYMLPDDDKLSKVTAYWLGQFEPWDSHRNLDISAAAGMIQMLPCFANVWSGENQDCALTGLHDHAMFRKFSYGRGCAQVSVDIRAGRTTRARALAWVRKYDGMFPNTYMNVGLDDVLKHLRMTEAELFAALDKHTNWDLFSGVRDGRPIMKELTEECPVTA